MKTIIVLSLLLFGCSIHSTKELPKNKITSLCTKESPCSVNLTVKPYKTINSVQGKFDKYYHIFSEENSNKEFQIYDSAFDYQWGYHYRVLGSYYWQGYGHLKVKKILSKKFDPSPFFTDGAIHRLEVKKLASNLYLLYKEIKVTVNNQALILQLERLIQEALLLNKTSSKITDNSWPRVRLFYKFDIDFKNRKINGIKLIKIIKEYLP